MINVKYDAEVGALTTFRISAPAKTLVEWHGADDLREALRLRGPFKALGGGSNMLFTGPYDGVVLRRVGEPQVEIDGGICTVDAHMELDRLCALTAMADLRGMENLSGIPGTLGGALVQNAGAYGVEIADVVASIDMMDLTTGETLTVNRDWMEYAYRTSRLKREDGRYIILSAKLRLLPGDFPANLDYGNLRTVIGRNDPTPAAVRGAVLAVRADKLPDPAVVGSAGSFFRNPEVPAKLLGDDMPRYALANGLYKVPAAWLIDHAGLKGAAVGGASLWPSQPLVIVNTCGTATAADVLGLEKMIVESVRDTFNITLQPEVEHL